MRSTALGVLLRLLTAGALAWFGSRAEDGWLRGLALLLAAAGLVPVPFALAALGQRLREIERGELDEAREY